MIDPQALLDDAREVTDLLVDDLRERSESDEASRVWVNGQYDRAVSAERTDKSLEEWREDLLAQTASSWTLACVFVRFCEDNRLVDTPLLSGPEERRSLARDHRSAWLSEHPTEGDRSWLLEVFERSKRLPGLSSVLGDANPIWSDLTPSEDGARALLDLWWKADDEGELVHDFTDDELDTRFLGDLYQDLSEHARKQYALLQTPEFIEEFILDRTLDPAIETFGLEEVRMIDPTCGSGHFLLGAFDRLVERWRQREPGTEARTLVQRALVAVHGVDINPFAVAIAQFRLLVAALRESGIDRLAAAPDFTFRVAAGDSLIHGQHVQDELVPSEHSIIHHFYAAENRELLAELLQEDHYHVVVGNPPYITVKDGAVRDAVREFYDEVCYGKYALSVPFAKRFHDLAIVGGAARPAGYVGQITSNSFMKRQMGKLFVNEWLPTKDVTHIIDTSGAYIPGHGTPTVILLSRNQWSQGRIRAVLGIRGEPGRPEEPSEGKVWSAIRRQVDEPGSESDYVSVEDVTDDRFANHPWSLQGGAAPEVTRRIEDAASRVLDEAAKSIGIAGFTLADDAFLMPVGTAVTNGLLRACRDWLTGSDIRDWSTSSDEVVIFPYDENLEPLAGALDEPATRWLWPRRTILKNSQVFGKSKVEAGLHWTEFGQMSDQKLKTSRVLTFAFVATHNHFALRSKQTFYNRHAQLLLLPDEASEEEHLALLGLLNSSTACFWMKQIFHCKGSTVDKAGARQTTIPFEDFYEFDSTKLKQFPLPDGAPAELARRLDAAAHRLADFLPRTVAEKQTPLSQELRQAMAMATRLRRAMVALQEELDWQCYRLYGLIGEDLTYSDGRLPELELGQRAFEIALARRSEAGEADSTWFRRHGSTPMTELPEDWPDDYRQLVERRLELIKNDRAIRLLEKPEHKRRWNWEGLDDLAIEAQERWLMDRIESWVSENAGEPEATTVARLADRLLHDGEARQVAEDLEGEGVDLTKLVGRLVIDEGVPFLACDRLKPAGLRSRAVWERTWEMQRIEDEIDRRVELPEDDPEHLTEEEAQVERKQQGVDKIPVPPKYKSAQYADKTTWKLRGKLDVPKERFVLYPETQLGADSSAVVGWAGWDHLQQARALAGLYMRRKQAGAGRRELGRLLAGIQELLPWVLQWHDEPDPNTGDRLGQFLTGFVDAERQGLGLTADDLTGAGPNEIDDGD